MPRRRRLEAVSPVPVQRSRAQTQPTTVARKASGRPALLNGALRMFREHSGTRAGWFRAGYAGLADRFGPFVDEATRAYASGVAALFVTFRQDTVALDDAVRARQQGRGRRPSASAITRLEKRQGLSWHSYDRALQRLEQLTGRQAGAGSSSHEAALQAALGDDEEDDATAAPRSQPRRRSSHA